MDLAVVLDTLAMRLGAARHGVPNVLGDALKVFAKLVNLVVRGAVNE